MSDNIAVLISGRGTNLNALIEASNAGKFGIAGVISNRPDAAGLAIAKRAHLPALTVDHRQFSDRDSFETALSNQLDIWQPELVVLAGFMRVLTDRFVERYLGRMINIHPSLLPNFPGLNTHQRALDAEVSEHGASVHFVTPTLDGGPVISQTKIRVRDDDTATTLADRLLPLEHQLLTETVNLLATNRVVYANEKVLFDGQTLPKPLLFPPHADGDAAGSNRNQH